MARTTQQARQDGATLAVAEGVLRAGAVVAALTALAFLLGGNGLGLLNDSNVPRALGELTGTRDAYAGVVAERAEVTGPDGLATVAALNERVGPLEQDVPTGHGAAESSGPTTVSIGFWALTRTERLAWVGVRILGALVPAAVLWLLATVVASARRGDPFTRRNARRLAVAAGTVTLGGTAAAWGTDLVRGWLLAGSEAAPYVAQTWTLDWTWVGVGLVLAVVAEVWRRGVAMREDLEGLV